MNEPVLTLEKVKQSFDDWRFNRRGNESIPDYLWEQVKILLLTYSRGELMRHLKLTTLQFRERGLISTDSGNIKKILPKFVQIPSTHSIAIQHQTESKLTIQRGDTQLCLYHPNNDHIQLMMNMLLR